MTTGRIVKRTISGALGGARGESFADLARRVGEVNGVSVAADATDAEVLDAVGDASGSGLAQAWAEGTEPGGPGTKSSKGHAEDAATAAASLNDRLEQITGSGIIAGVKLPDGTLAQYQLPDLNFMLPDPDTGLFASVQDTMKAASPVAGSRAIDVTASNGFAGNWTDSDFGLHLLGLDGTVQDRINALDSTVEASLDAEADRVNATTTRAMFESEKLRAAGVTGIYYNSIIKAHGADGTETQRIPGLVVLSATTALVAWQQRLAGYGATGDATYQRLVCALVTYTPGVGISVGSTVVIDAPVDVSKNSNHPHMFLNGSGQIVCIFNSTDNVAGKYRAYRRVSTDNGATWSARVEVASAAAGGDYIALGSNGTVVQIPTGYPNAGRWLVPIYGVGDFGSYSGFLVSDDDGETWTPGALLYNGLPIQEPSFALTHEGDVLMAMRRSDDPYLVHFARFSLDPGTDWIDMGLASNMVTATCDMSMVQVAPTLGSGVPAIAHCGPSIIARRANRIRLSYDCGRTWQWSFKRPDVADTSGNGAGYTSIKMLAAGLFIVAYETAESAATNSDLGIYIVNIEKVLTDGTAL